MKLLVVEDYFPLRKSLVKGLLEAGHAVDATGDGAEGDRMARDAAYDVIVLDLMLPGVDGWEILRGLRGKGVATPVLILTARDALPDRVRGLNAGADDYLVKPFAFEELLARIGALARRKYGTASSLIRVGDLEIDRAAQRVRRGGDAVDLTAGEYAVLELLALRAGQIVSPADIERHLYTLGTEPASNVIHVMIHRIRAKTEAGGRPRILHTRRGAGYVVEDGRPCDP